jgi:predicted transcriptional regulator of viral defense system
MQLFMQDFIMTKSQESRLRKMGFFKLAEAKQIGVSQPMLSRLVKQGKITRVGRGIYTHPKAKVSSEAAGFQIAQAKFGDEAAIGGLSALFYYNLIEQVPTQTWVIVTPRVWTKEKGYRLLRTKLGTDIGVEDKEGFRIVSIERALIESLRFSTKIGTATALKAVRAALKNKQTNLAKLRKMANALKLEPTLVRHIEAITL